MVELLFVGVLVYSKHAALVLLQLLLVLEVCDVDAVTEVVEDGFCLRRHVQALVFKNVEAIRLVQLSFIAALLDLGLSLVHTRSSNLSQVFSWLLKEVALQLGELLAEQALAVPWAVPQLGL